MEVAAARRAKVPRWVNLRTVLGLILFSIALLSGSLVLGTADRGTLVWAASQDLPEGASLGPGDLEVVAVELPPGQLASYLGSSTPLAGSTLLRPVRRGELLSAAWVTEQGAVSSRSIAIPIPAEHAVGGVLRPGDRVDVFATLQTAGAAARTVLLVQGAEVEGLLRSDGLVMEEKTFAGITLSVSPTDAARIAFAVRTSEIDVVRMEGASDEQVAASSVRAGDL